MLHHSLELKTAKMTVDNAPIPEYGQSFLRASDNLTYFVVTPCSLPKSSNCRTPALTQSGRSVMLK